jgi:hypothetical protein
MACLLRVKKSESSRMKMWRSWDFPCFLRENMKEKTYCVYSINIDVFQRVPDKRRNRTVQPGLAQRLGGLVGGSVAGLWPTSGRPGHPPAPGRGHHSCRCRGYAQNVRQYPDFAHMKFFYRLPVLAFLCICEYVDRILTSFTNIKKS